MYKSIIEPDIEFTSEISSQVTKHFELREQIDATKKTERAGGHWNLMLPSTKYSTLNTTPLESQTVNSKISPLYRMSTPDDISGIILFTQVA